ncbi:hypothetical protein AB0K18_49845 [Nonomuraea sp. NPDC049421]|uniref:three-helix bundle dimerization domain-containing protein n=1 Tax=Nonomuraea sp. NPDC049421 TaxID=3155275 RepID=UPI0034480532
MGNPARWRASTAPANHRGTPSSRRPNWWSRGCRDQFAGRAVIANYLPLLAERFARRRLRALARIEGKDAGGLPTVLFLCVHNAGRSQMALGFFTRLAGVRALLADLGVPAG